MKYTANVGIEKLPPKRPIPPQPLHHVGAPPTSFVNPWSSFHKHSPLELLLGSRTDRNFQPIPARDQLVVIRRPDWGKGRDGLKATWVGHASFLIESPAQSGAERGVRVFFDPLFSERTSPVSWAGPKRYTPTPCVLGELPDVDLVIISHDHYDHLDSDTLQKIYKRRKGNVHFLVPLGNAARLIGMGIQREDVTQLDWWKSVRVNVPSVGSVDMTCTPSQHSSGRGLFDQGSTLWSSWVLEANDSSNVKKVFFAGDTGYRYVPKDADEDRVERCPVFQEIGDTFGPFDLCLLPIGLFLPRHFLSPLHCSPEDALCLHEELKSKRSIGMHYGTVRGGISQNFEEVTEPPRRFREACEKGGKVWGEDLDLLDVGETAIIL